MTDSQKPARRKVFLSFADPRLNRSLNRIKLEAENLGVFDLTLTKSSDDLATEFLNEFKDELKLGSRGFGYWVWKPQIILQTLDEMRDGDLLAYADVGFHINPKGKTRLLEYFDLVQKSKSGVLGFQGRRPELPMKDDGRPLPTWPEREYSKGDLLDFFNVRGVPEILESPQFHAGLLFIRKCSSSVSFVNEWLNVFRADFKLADDTPSRSANEPGFREHRHDQSIYSILSKMRGTDSISSNEFWYPKSWISQGDWAALEDFPFHARRDMDFGPIENFKRKTRRTLMMFMPSNFWHSVKLMVGRIRLRFEPNRTEH